MGRVCEFQCGDVVLDLVNDVRFSIDKSWEPKVATRRKSRIGNQSLIADVVETLPIKVKGRSSDETWSAVQEIGEMLNMISAYETSESGNPVIFRVKSANASLLQPLEALVLSTERVNTGREAMNVLELSNTSVIVTIQFLRRGSLLETEDLTVISLGWNPSGLCGITPSANFTAWNTPSPTRVQLIGTRGEVSSVKSKGHLIVTSKENVDALDRIGYRSASDTVPVFNGTGTVVASATTEGGDFLRVYPATSTIDLADDIYDQLTLDPKVKRWNLFMRAQIVGGLTWRVSAVDAFDDTIIQSTVVLDGAVNSMDSFYIGSIDNLPVTDENARLRLVLSPSAIHAGSNEIRIQGIVLVADDDEAYVTRIENFGESSGITLTANVDHSALESYSPRFYTTNTPTADDRATGFGDLFIEMRGKKPQGIYFGVTNSMAVGNTSTGTIQIDFRRRPAHLFVR